MHKLFPYLIASFLFASCESTPPVEIDLLIKGATLIDGTGAEGFTGDIGIQADTLVFVGSPGNIRYLPKQTIDATGFVLAPGFIDPHTHAMEDLSDSIGKTNLNYLFQGVTTVFTGSDGRSPIELGKRLDQWDANGIGTNATMYAGFNSIRGRIMGMRDDPATPEELEQMKSLVAKAMDDGAMGLSAGLYYAPGSYASTEEVIELAKIAAQKGGVYDAHIRDESTYSVTLKGAIEESIRIAREAGIHSNIGHIKCLGVDVWDTSDEMIALIEAARAEGLSVSADQYPYPASGTSITGALVPTWVLADDPDPLPKFDNPALKAKIVADMQENLRKRGGPATLLITSAKDTSLVGKNLEEIAQAWQLDPIEAAIAIFRKGGAGLASFNMKDTDIENFMRQPWCMTSSDGSTGHPRKYGSFPRKIKTYVLEKQILSLEQMIHKSTGLTAETFGLEKRGLLKPGYYADLIVFQPEAVKDEATYEQPELLASGMHYVIVNGKIAVEKGNFTGLLAGRTLRNGK